MPDPDSRSLSVGQDRSQPVEQDHDNFGTQEELFEKRKLSHSEYLAEAEQIKSALLEKLPTEATQADVLHRSNTFTVRFSVDKLPSDESLQAMHRELQAVTDQTVKVVLRNKDLEDRVERLLIVSGDEIQHIEIGRSTESQKTSGASHQPAKFRAKEIESELARTKPDGCGAWTISYYKTQPDNGGLRFGVVRMQLPDDLIDIARSWLATLEQKFNMPMLLQPRRARNGIDEQLQSLADDDGLIRDAGRVHRAMQRLHGGKVPEVTPLERPTNLANVVDLRELHTVTIDPEGARDLDDAISVRAGTTPGSLQLLVSFADVSWRIKPGDPVDEYARTAAFTAYGLEMALPMIGENLAFNELSLLEGTERLAFTVMMEIDPQKGIVDSDIFRSLVSIDKRYTPESFDRDLWDQASGLSTQSYLSELVDAASRLRRERVSKARFIEIDGANIGSKVVEECMIAAKQEIAKFFENNQIPALYKVHTQPGLSVRQGIVDKLNTLGIPAELEDLNDPLKFGSIIRILANSDDSSLAHEILDIYQKRSHYDIRNRGHYALGLDAYTEIKGLRNYAGLVNQWQVAHALSGEAALGESELLPIQRQINRKKRTQDDIIFRMITLEKILNKLEQQGQEFLAVARESSPQGIEIEVPGFTSRGLIRRFEAVQIGAAQHPDSSNGVNYLRVCFEGYDPKVRRFVFTPVLDQAA